MYLSSLCTQTLHTCERVWLHKSKFLGLLQNLNETVKQHLLEYCSSERIHVSLLCVSVTQVPSQTTAWYMLCAFKVFSNSWKSLLYMCCTRSCHQAYSFESGIHKVATEPPDVIERLAGVQPFVLFLLYFKSLWYSKYNFQLVPLQCVMIL